MFHQRLHEWFYNRVGQKGRKAERGVAELLNSLIGRTKGRRTKSLVEYYSKRYYKEKIEVHVRTRSAELNPTTRGERLDIVKKCTKKAWGMETFEFKAGVEKEWIQWKEGGGEEEDEAFNDLTAEQKKR